MSRIGILLPHDCVIGFLAWDGYLFMSAGSEGKVHLWTWINTGPTTVGAAVIGTMTGIPGAGSLGVPGIRPMPSVMVPSMGLSAPSAGIQGIPDLNQMPGAAMF